MNTKKSCSVAQAARRVGKVPRNGCGGGTWLGDVLRRRLPSFSHGWGRANIQPERRTLLGMQSPYWIEIRSNIAFFFSAGRSVCNDRPWRSDRPYCGAWRAPNLSRTCQGRNCQDVLVLKVPYYLQSVKKRSINCLVLVWLYALLWRAHFVWFQSDHLCIIVHLYN